jgi:hypothetical protein
MKNISLLIFYSFLSITLFSQDIIKTSEYIDNKKRRDLFYNSKMNLVKEIYYDDFNQKIVNIIKYDSIQNLVYFSSYKEYPKINIEVDFQKGIYKDPENKIELHFKDDFIFHGQQIGDKIIVNYKEGQKFGRLIQTDSGVSGKQTYVYQKVDPRYLKFNMLVFYNEIGTEDTYKLFNGVLLNFKNNVLDGIQKSYYINGDNKIISNYSNGIISDYTSYDKEKNILSKIVTDSGFIKRPIILNGVLTKLEDKSKFNQIFTLKNTSLDKTGDIIRENLYSNTNFYNYDLGKKIEDYFFNFIDKYGQVSKIDLGYNNYTISKILNPIELKNIFDEKKLRIPNGELLRIILSIPKFSIQRLNFQNDEKFEIVRSDTLKLDNPDVIKLISNSFGNNGKIQDLLFKNDFRELTIPENYIFFKSIVENTIKNINQLENKTYKFKNPFESDLFNPSYSSFRLFFERSSVNLLGRKERYYSLDSNIYIELHSKDQIEFKKYDDKYVFIFGTNSVGDLIINNVLKYHKDVEVTNFSKINNVNVDLSEFTKENILQKLNSMNGFQNIDTIQDIILSGKIYKSITKTPFKIKYILPDDLSFETYNSKNQVFEKFTKFKNKYLYLTPNFRDSSDFIIDYIDVLYSINSEKIFFEKNYKVNIIGIENEYNINLLNVEFSSPSNNFIINKFYDINTLLLKKSIINFKSKNIENTIKIYINSFNNVNGFTFPNKFKFVINEDVIEYIIDNIETNTGIKNFN